MANFICRRGRAHFSDLLDGEELPLLRRIEAKLHAHVCPSCRPMFVSLRATRDALRALNDEPAGPERSTRPPGD